VGLGRSGLAAAKLCLEQGAKVHVTDSRTADQLGPDFAEIAPSVQATLGEHPEDIFTEASLIVLSPGVPPMPQLEAARKAGVAITGELELASRFCQGRIVAITGTNGKSTTTSLVGEMFAAAGRDVFVGGNLGAPLAEGVLAKHPGCAAGGYVVLEVSSFQLETVETFHAHIAVLLNLSEDHLDRYPDYDSYIAAKGRIFERQRIDDYAITNADPDQYRCRMVASESVAPLLTFRSEKSRGSGAWVADDSLCVRLPRGKHEWYPRKLLGLPGLHNSQNAMAALLISRLSGVSQDCCQTALADFRGLPHRMQLVGERNGVAFYNDSKATNVGAVVGSLTGFERPIVLIAGGTDKGGEYEPLREVVSNACRHVILIGAAADKIESALNGTVALHRAESMEKAVELGRFLAAPGDAVVLSPACSSFDMFRNYAHRGDTFAEAVQKLS
jgi:UDP-N-acetylmuramoylalanine--D-glutamate ligase